MFYRSTGKNIFDGLVAFVSILILSWLFLIILLGYLILWEFPVFFKQKRIGQNNIPFWMWKFRTLSTDKKLLIHERNFAWGNFLRFTSFDELPQLWNILRGEMSFIGPRPLPEEYLPLYSEEQIKRHKLKPGITGWAQVNGRNSITWQKKFELDLHYVNNISFKLDLIILIRTITLILSFKKDVSLTEEKFKGN
ncbi:MAG TPA: sugar transferase [Chitinophagaceae bacterium]|nr:sugar transferase [Chitinophagaceae bacterium]